MVIKQVGPLSCAKIAGTLYAIIGVVIGAIFSIISLASGFGANSSGSAAFGALMGAGAIVAFPILCGGMGFLTTLIAAWLYNVLAGLVGGVEVVLE